jgi:chromosome segregation ATPase
MRKEDNNHESKKTCRSLTPSTETLVQSTVGRPPSRTSSQRGQTDDVAPVTLRWATTNSGIQSANDTDINIEEEIIIHHEEIMHFLQAELQRERLQNLSLQEENYQLANEVLELNESCNYWQHDQEINQTQRRRMQKAIDHLTTECDCLRIKLQTQADVPAQLQIAHRAQQDLKTKLNNAAATARFWKRKW